MRVTCQEIFEITERLEFQRESVLGERMRKTAVQIVEEIAEGFERETRRDFANFARMAKGSNGEARAQLYVAQRYLRDGELDKLLGLNTDIGKMLRGLRRSLVEPARRV
ncbi:MAG: four helix bundle protein [Vicinamibacterales bacterium]